MENGLFYKNCLIESKENIKIASFDLDNTLIKTKSEMYFQFHIMIGYHYMIILN